jgi:hypothetical protein
MYSAERRLTEASRERIRLRAGFVSSLASNIVATGTLGSILAFIFADRIDGGQSFIAAAFALLCFFGGFGLHFLAEGILEGLDE